MDTCIREIGDKLKELIQQCQENLPHLQAMPVQCTDLINDVVKLAIEILQQLNQEIEGMDVEPQVSLKLLHQLNQRIKQLVEDLYPDLGVRPELQIVLQVLDEQLQRFEQEVQEMDEEEDGEEEDEGEEYEENEEED